MKRKLYSILGLVGLLTAPAAFAQNPTPPASSFNASNYGQWGIKSQTANTYLFSPGGLCSASAYGANFFPFNTNAPVLIVDATPANTEVVTPSSVTNNNSQCGFVASPSNSHFSFQVLSGTGGLQEALNANAIAASTTAYPAPIVLDRNWYQAAGGVPGTTPAAIIAAAKGNAHAYLQDITTAGPTYYVWNGTAYASGTWVNTVPTAAAGSAAGSGPTVGTVTGSALAPTFTLTTGTSTTTGTLFTLTYIITTQFKYAPTCTATTVGANSFSAFTIASTGSSGAAAVVTVTATSAPTASTAYTFKVSCK